MDDAELAKKYLTGDTVLDRLKNDPETYYSWLGNIAVSFQDAYSKFHKKYKNRNDIHRISNEAAKHFLDLLLNE